MLSRVNSSIAFYYCTRCISSTTVRYAESESVRRFKKWDSRKPWDKRFPVNAKDVGPAKEGGSQEMLEILPEKLVAPTGIFDNQTKKFIPVPEMVPEFVVPDLTDFPLKPYVTYTAKEIKQNELTPKDIFNSVYAAEVEAAVKSGKIKVQDGQVVLEDGNVLDLETGQRIS